MLGHQVELGAELVLGGGVIIHSGTVVGDGCELQDHAVLGKQPRLGPHSSGRAAGHVAELHPLMLATGAIVCTGAVVYAGARVGEGAIVGDQSQVRERSTVGAQSVVGRGTSVESDVTIHSEVRIQSNCFLAPYTVVEDGAFIGPGVVTANDNTIGRHDRGRVPHGPRLGRACRIGAGAVIAPGLEVGEEAFVAAGAVVVADVPARAVVMGVPARHVREVPATDTLEQWL
jgi:acetyltransferase-like isoleucine patch superfamily enzyme